MPIFKSLEKDQTGGDPKYHSKDGEWPVVRPQDVNKTAKRFIKAGSHIGLPQNSDFNDASQLGLVFIRSIKIREQGLILIRHS